jgi:hypothetical protein
MTDWHEHVAASWYEWTNDPNVHASCRRPHDHTVRHYSRDCTCPCHDASRPVAQPMTDTELVCIVPGCNQSTGDDADLCPYHLERYETWRLTELEPDHP